MGVQFPKGRWKKPHQERPCLETNHRFPTFAPISHPSAQNLSTLQPNYQLCRNNRNGYRRIDNPATAKLKISTLTSCGKALRAETTDRNDRSQPHHLRSVVSLCEFTTWSRSYFQFCP